MAEAAANSTATGGAVAKAPPADDGAFTGVTLWTVGFLLATANFFAVLDTTITNVSVPNIAGGLAVSPAEGTWTITSYSVAEAITVPLTGWLAARFGTVTVFCTALVLFAVFSAACGLAPSLGFLVAGRVLQGLAGGPMIPLSQTLLLRVFPKHMAGMAIALWSMTTVVAPIAGPLLGGAICDNVGWPWIFFINLPFAIAVAFFAWQYLKPKETPGVRAKVDVVGLGLLVVWISAMQIMLDKGKELDWFQSPLIIGLLIVAVVGFIAFMIWELTEKNPIVSLRVFRHRSFATACIVMALAFGGFFSANVLVPLWLQTNLGYTATWAGRATAFGGILAVVFSPIVGRYVGKFDPRALIMFGISWMALMMVWRSTFTTGVNFDHLIWPQLLQGLGVPFFFIPLMTLGTASLPPDEIASGASMISFVRTTAGAFAVSITTTAWEDGGDKARVQILNQGGGFEGAVASLQTMGLSAAQAARQFEGLVQSQAVMVATDRLFLIIAAVLFVAGCTVWIAPKPKAGARAAPGGH
ncbi:MAG: DHA2 family efflux MFS transporter permease subunit [Pseudomonadota bacterium]|nr:DHA2 family efflux MFS transporter permease subunit [Pseudomonadota bacterium]